MTSTLSSKIQRSAIVLSSAAVRTPARSAASPAAALHRAISTPTRGLVTSPQSRVVPGRLAPSCSLQTKSSLNIKSASARQVQTRWNSDDASSVKLREWGFEDVCTSPEQTASVILPPLPYYYFLRSEYPNKRIHITVVTKLTKTKLDQRRPPNLNPGFPNPQAHNLSRRTRARRTKRHGYNPYCSVRPGGITGRCMVSHARRIRDPVRIR